MPTQPTPFQNPYACDAGHRRSAVGGLMKGAGVAAVLTTAGLGGVAHADPEPFGGSDPVFGFSDGGDLFTDTAADPLSSSFPDIGPAFPSDPGNSASPFAVDIGTALPAFPTPDISADLVIDGSSIVPEQSDTTDLLTLPPSSDTTAAGADPGPSGGAGSDLIVPDAVSAVSSPVTSLVPREVEVVAGGGLLDAVGAGGIGSTDVPTTDALDAALGSAAPAGESTGSGDEGGVSGEWGPEEFVRLTADEVGVSDEVWAAEVWNPEPAGAGGGTVPLSGVSDVMVTPLDWGGVEVADAHGLWDAVDEGGIGSTDVPTTVVLNEALGFTTPEPDPAGSVGEDTNSVPGGSAAGVSATSVVTPWDAGGVEAARGDALRDAVGAGEFGSTAGSAGAGELGPEEFVRLTADEEGVSDEAWAAEVWDPDPADAGAGTDPLWEVSGEVTVTPLESGGIEVADAEDLLQAVDAGGIGSTDVPTTAVLDEALGVTAPDGAPVGVSVPPVVTPAGVVDVRGAAGDRSLVAGYTDAAETAALDRLLAPAAGTSPEPSLVWEGAEQQYVGEAPTLGFTPPGSTARLDDLLESSSTSPGADEAVPLGFTPLTSLSAAAGSGTADVTPSESIFREPDGPSDDIEFGSTTVVPSLSEAAGSSAVVPNDSIFSGTSGQADDDIRFAFTPVQPLSDGSGSGMETFELGPAGLFGGRPAASDSRLGIAEPGFDLSGTAAGGSATTGNLRSAYQVTAGGSQPDATTTGSTGSPGGRPANSGTIPTSPALDGTGQAGEVSNGSGPGPTGLDAVLDGAIGTVSTGAGGTLSTSGTPSSEGPADRTGTPSGGTAAQQEGGGSSNLGAVLGYTALGVPFGIGVGTMFRLYDPAMQGSLKLAGLSSLTRVVPGALQDVGTLGGGSSVPLTGDPTIDRFLHGQVVDTAVITAADIGLTTLANPAINRWGEANPTRPLAPMARVARLNSGLPWTTLAAVGPVLSTANTLTDSFETDVLGWETDPESGRPKPPDNDAYYGDLNARSAILGGTIFGAAQSLRNPQWAQQVGDATIAAPGRVVRALTNRTPGVPTPTSATPDVPTVAPAAADDAARAAVTTRQPRALSIAGTVLPFALPYIQNWIANRVTNPPPERDGLSDVIDGANQNVVQPLQRAFGSAAVQQTGSVIGDAAIGCVSGLTTRANCAAGAVATGGLAFRDKTTIGRNATQDVLNADGTVGDALLDNVGASFGHAGNVLDVGLNGLNAGLATIAAGLVPLHELTQYGSTRPVGLQERLQFLAEEPSVQATNRAANEYVTNIRRMLNNAGTMATGSATGLYNLTRTGDVRGTTPTGQPWCSSTVTSSCIEPDSVDPNNRNSVGRERQGRAVPGNPYYEEARRRGLAGPATPDNPVAYERCVDRGQCGVREVGPLYVGDGSNSPGNQIETFARNLTNPTYLPRQLSNVVDNAVNTFQRDPLGTVLRVAPQIFR